jgi:hypothetical protein
VNFALAVKQTEVAAFDENVQDAEIVIQECEMQRYRPGIQKDFIPRWV